MATDDGRTKALLLGHMFVVLTKGMWNDQVKLVKDNSLPSYDKVFLVSIPS